MYKQLQLIKLVKEDFHRCEELYKQLIEVFESLPEGSVVMRNGNAYHAFRQNGKQTQHRITEPKMIDDLKLRQFLKRGLPLLKQRIDADAYFLNNWVLYDPVQIFGSMAIAYDKVEGYNVFLQGDLDPDNWAETNYTRNTCMFTSEHYTEHNVQVRSKAEAMIGTQLERRGWSYICEPKMSFGTETKCPDFAVMMPRTRKIVFLEHFGRMDDIDYVKDTMNKLVLYSLHGLRLGDNFFFTWEMKDKPLTIPQINATLDLIDSMDRAAIEF